LGREIKKSTPLGLRDLPIVYHDDQDDGRLVIDFGSERYGDARVLAQIEDRSEEARLLYVGLTRAINRCVVFWGESASWLAAPIASLLTGSNVTPPTPHLDHAGARAYLAEIASDSDGMLAIMDLPQTPEPLFDLEENTPLVARELAAPLVTPWRLASFSSLQRRSQRFGATERPDHDQDAAPLDPLLLVKTPTPASDALRFRFPRGAAAGECLHRVLEDLRFDRNPADSSELIAEVLKTHGFPARLAPELAGWLGEVVATPLFAHGFPLSAVDRADQIREMEFHLPLLAVDAARLAPLARAHGLSLQSLAPENLEGFLKGFIDLVVRHEGRFYLIDYKSNWLGEGFENYQGLALANAMEGGGYTLQYLIYTLALYRWLRFRNPEFDYERDFGGICYLFIRGMAPGVVDPAGSPGGVYFERPPIALVEALDALFKGGAA
jgi:exodeoxyribonuclease V beta subunit